MLLDKEIWSGFLALKEKAFNAQGLISQEFTWSKPHFLEVKKEGLGLEVKLFADRKSNVFEETFLGPNLMFKVHKGINLILKKACSIYLPIILGPKITQGKPFFFSHFAQSLDGYISTKSGHSKWIGNDINLIHAHRLRALADAIIIGGTTLKNDLPKLNVRMVEGSNPKRIVISGKSHSFNSLMEASDDEILLLHKAYDKPAIINNQIRKISIETENGVINPNDVSKILSQENHKCIMIEGGAETIGHFLKASKIDYCQIHISPMYFGAGRSPYTSIKDIVKVSEAKSFSFVNHFRMGDGIMMTGYES